MIDKIKDMGIYELRNFARELGIHSPTTLKRDELIEQISGVLNGKIIIKEPASNRGRPPRKENMSTIFNNTFSKGEDTLYNLDKYEFLFINQVSAPSPVYENNIKQESSASFIKSGIVEVLAGGNARLVDLDNFDLDSVLIGSDLVKKYRLKSGMNINCFCHKVCSDKEQFIAKIIDEASLPKVEVEYSKLKNDIPMEIIKVNNSFEGLKKLNRIYPLCKGQKGFLICDKELDLTDVANKVAGAFEGVKTIATLSSDLGIKNTNNFEEVVTYQSTEILSKKARKFEITIEIAKRMAENGEDAVVIVGNFSNLFKTYYQMFLTKNISESIAKEDAIQILKYFFNNAKNTEKGSLTLLILTRDDENLLKEFSEVINYQVKFTKTSLNIDGIDFKKSFSVNPKINYEAVQKTLENFNSNPNSI